MIRFQTFAGEYEDEIILDIETDKNDEMNKKDSTNDLYF